MNKFNFYAIKILFALFLLFGLLFFLSNGYSSYKLWYFVDSTRKIQEEVKNNPKYSQIEQKMKDNGQQTVSSEDINKGLAHTQSLSGLAAIGSVAGLIIFIAGIGLLFFKKWGFYLSILGIVIIWGFYWLIVGGISENIFLLVVVSLFGMYIVYNKNFMNKYNQSIS